MARVSVEKLITTPATPNYLSDAAYDYTKWNLGKGLIKNTGGTATDNYMAPHFDIIRPLEESTSFAIANVFSYNFSATLDYLWGVENTTASATTRRIHMWEINKKTGARNWNGFITITLSGVSEARVTRDFKIDVKTETTGTAACSAATVTGSGTAFVDNKVAVGARIGFGSSDPTQITTWYRITARTDNTTLTVSPAPGTVANGAYVIQEFRPVVVTTSATAANGGIYYAKGVSIEDYISGGTTIALAVATDDLKATYWLKDTNPTQTNTLAAGCAIDFTSATPTNLTTYVLDLVSAGNYRVFKYNIRAALASISSGATVSAWQLTTGNAGVSGTGSQNSNLSIATAAHGVGSGVKSLYFLTTTNWYRADVANITSAAVNWTSDNIPEKVTGGLTTYVVNNLMTSIEYVGDLDSFIISTTGIYNYMTKYVPSGSEFELVWGKSTGSLDQLSKNAGLPSTMNIGGVAFSMSDSGNTNLVYMAKNSATAGISIIYIVPVGCHWDYGSGTLISPEITTSNAAKYYRAHPIYTSFLGTQALGKQTEPFETYARTSSIQTDSTTGWVLLNDSHSLAGLSGAASIQFKFEFKILGDTCIPARIMGIECTYEDTTTDSHYTASVGKSNLTSKIFAFWFKTAFGTTVPNLRISLYDADTNGLLLTDTTALHASGTFEKTTDGSTWGAYDQTDRGNSTTWIRYTPSSLADNVKIAAYLTQV
jgi:hypothetical protein